MSVDSESKAVGCFGELDLHGRLLIMFEIQNPNSNPFLSLLVSKGELDVRDSKVTVREGSVK